MKHNATRLYVSSLVTCLIGAVCFSAVLTRVANAQLAGVAQDGSPTIVREDVLIPEKQVFGASLFKGRFATQSFVGFNSEYILATSDRISVKLWGGFSFDDVLTIDQQGNVFLPNVGPVKLRGVTNENLNDVITGAVKGIYKANVGVYASLEAAEPVKVFVTGFVQNPGLYSGHSSDALLRFIDLAGGIRSGSGSYIDVRVIRNGRVLHRVSLYDFLLKGEFPVVQLRDGDSVFIAPLGSQVGITGDVQNRYLFEFSGGTILLSTLLEQARPEPSATHVRIARGNKQTLDVEYIALSDVDGIALNPGDRVEVTSDQQVARIFIRVEGEHFGQQELVLPYGARLQDALDRIEWGEDARRDSVQLMRQSVKERQKEMLLAQLQALESSVLTARSKSEGEARLRKAEADLVLQWVERARRIEPRGMVVLANSEQRGSIILEAGDIIRIPRKSQVVMIHGDVVFPSAVAWKKGASIGSYIELSGGFTQGRRSANVLLLHADGTFKRARFGRGGRVSPGDEIFVLPKVRTKSLQLTRDITEVLYQIAVSAGVVFAL